MAQNYPIGGRDFAADAAVKKLAFKDWNFREPSPSNQMSV
jgi:hypothetical protein